jgi:hypothetical protein
MPEGPHINQLWPRRTHFSNKVFQLPGGNEDNDLWIEIKEYEGGQIGLISTWVPSERQRKEIAKGANIDLIVFGTQHPPVAVALSYTPIGKRPPEEDENPGV